MQSLQPVTNIAPEELKHIFSRPYLQLRDLVTIRMAQLTGAKGNELKRLIHSPEDLDRRIDFARDILEGFNCEGGKFFKMKYSYDKEGTRLWEKLTKHPDYYLTRSEQEIITDNTHEISKLMPKGDFELVELGPGNASKTEFLISELQKQKRKFTYVPIDISQTAVQKLKTKLLEKFDGLNIEAEGGDYLKVLKERKNPDTKRFILYFGATVGNYMEKQAGELLETLRSALNPGDRVLLGFDLKKDERIIMAAYDNEVTDAKDINCLARINRELGANFDLEKFKPYRHYDEKTGALERYLEATDSQKIRIPALKKIFCFEKGERIYLGQSVKYDERGIKRLAEVSGFKVLDNASFYDSKGYFVDSCWEAV